MNNGDTLIILQNTFLRGQVKLPDEEVIVGTDLEEEEATQLLHSNRAVIKSLGSGSGTGSGSGGTGSTAALDKDSVVVPILASETEITAALPAGFTLDDLTSKVIEGAAGVNLSDSVQESGANLIFTLTSSPAESGSHSLKLNFIK